MGSATHTRPERASNPDAPRALRRDGLVERIAPFAAIAFLAVALAPIGGAHDAGTVTLAAVVTVALVIACFVVPWARLPQWCEVLPALAYLPVIALLRDAEGGGSSGYAALYLLPVIWHAFYGTVRQVLAVLAGTAVALAAPIVLIGAPTYMEHEWRRLIFLIAIGGATGLLINRLVTSNRRLSAEAVARSQDLVIARDEAVRANLAKTRFLSGMSHELRTPLNAINGFSGLIEKHSADPEARRQAAHIHLAGQHLLALIDDLVLVTRIEQQALPLQIEAVNLSAVLKGIAATHQGAATEAGVIVRLNLPAGDLWLRTDERRLTQVLHNLLSNAIKYNRAGGETVVSASQANGTVRVEVSDQGEGIDPEHLARLFVPFDRLGAERSGVEGTGLGLPVTKALVEVMGGRLEVLPNRPQGSVFAFELASAAAPAAANGTPARHAEAAAAISGTILYIEDTAMNVRLVEHILAQRPQIKLLSASTGQAGIELAREVTPDLLLLDLHLPDLEGVEVFRVLRADPRTREIPVVWITADVSDEGAGRLRAEGRDRVLEKPLDIGRFLAIVDELLARDRP